MNCCRRYTYQQTILHGSSGILGQISQSLSEYIVSSRFEQLPSCVVEQMKMLTLDSIGCAFGCFVRLPMAKILVEYAKDLAAKPDSSILGDKTKIPCSLAAAINAQMAGISLQYDDN